MPFGLTNAPASFQRLMECVLAGLSPEQCLIYLDDVIIFSSNFDEHLEQLHKVFDRLATAKIAEPLHKLTRKSAHGLHCTGMVSVIQLFKI